MRRPALRLLPVALVVALMTPATSLATPQAAEDNLAAPASAPAAIVLVSAGEDPPRVEAHGHIDGRPVDADTPFLVGSLSKAFTAIAVMQQVEAGNLEIDAPLGDQVPEALSTVSVRQLLWHTSGLSRRAGLERADIVDDDSGALGQLVRSLVHDDLGPEPGTTYQYSDANYMVLGHLVETVTGTPFGSYLEREVLAPLGMTRSAATRATAEKLGVSAGHRLVLGQISDY